MDIVVVILSALLCTCVDHLLPLLFHRFFCSYVYALEVIRSCALLNLFLVHLPLSDSKAILCTSLAVCLCIIICLRIIICVCVWVMLFFFLSRFVVYSFFFPSFCFVVIVLTFASTVELSHC